MMENTTPEEEKIIKDIRWCVNMADGGCKWELIKIVMDVFFYLSNACK